MGADSAQIADAVALTWSEIDAALTPVIGQRGVAALYIRSLYLVRSAHPWLASADDGAQTAIDLARLKSVLAQQSSSDAAAGGGALLQTFYDLLASLVGRSLTERMLRSIWAKFSSGPTAKDMLS
jgi:hypothetical protein